MKKNRPQPLDLEGTVENLADMIFNFCGYGRVEMGAILKREIEQCIKSACEFYLRYKNRPGLLREERPQLFERIPEVSGASCKNCKYLGSDSGTECFWYVCNHPHFLSIDVETPTVPPLDQNRRPLWCPLDLEGYSNWLFKLAFGLREDGR